MGTGVPPVDLCAKRDEKLEVQAQFELLSLSKRAGCLVVLVVRSRYAGAMKAALAEPEIVTRKGKPVSVIIPIKDYEELLERVEGPKIPPGSNAPGASRCSIVRWKITSQNAAAGAMYRVLLERGAERASRDSPPISITASLRPFERWRTTRAPPGCRKLAGSENDWRIRVGDYRVIYEIANRIRVVRVARVRHRREVYR